MFSAFVLSRIALRALISFSMLSFSDALILSPTSSRAFCVWNAIESASLRASMPSLRFLSCASNSAASFTALSISASDILEPEVIVMCCSLPVPRSLADTFTIPLASISNVTSILGIPLGAGAIPSSLNSPRSLLSLANCLSPCTTLMSTAL